VTLDYPTTPSFNVTSYDAALALEDGAVFRGRSFGASVDAEAEVVFNTCMTGYQEIATDASYRGQIVALTYPLIGVYGVAEQHRESRQPWISGLVVRECYDDPSNWTAEGSLADYLRRWGIPGICEVDTRALTRRLRARGALRAVLVADARHLSDATLVERARAVTPLSEKDLVADASAPGTYDYATGAGERRRVVAIDCGIKENILRSLGRRGVAVTVVPHTATAAEILALRPDGIVISNGPGDPARLTDAVETVRGLVQGAAGKGVPILGICLGHQLLGMAAGGTTSRLPFGHHGGNHPVLDLPTQQVHITSQNHEFQVDADSIPPSSGFYVSQVNLNDRSVEGLRHEDWPIFSVQYHPEGAPGPQDNQYIFDRFVGLCSEDR
jgi:carbamoyl-phosphate synthase small subunit